MEVTNPLLVTLYQKRDELNSTTEAMFASVNDDNRTDFNEAEQANYDDAKKELDKLNARILELTSYEESKAKVNEARAKTTPVDGGFEFVNGKAIKVGTEAKTYNEASQFSYVTDYVMAFSANDRAAQERMNSHVAEMNFASTTTSLDASTPPKYLVDDYLSAAASVRAVVNALPKFPWVDGMVHYYPRITGTASVGTATENTTLSNTDPTDDNISTNVVFKGGFQDFSSQVLTQASINWEREAFRQLGEQYGIATEEYVLRDSTEGLYNVAGKNTVTYTDASPTVAELLSKVAQAKVAVSAARYFPANAIVLADRVWQWVLAQSDTTGRPLAEAYGQSVNAIAAGSTLTPQGPAGSFAGLPVYVSATAIPLDGATPGTSNTMIVCRTNEMRFREQGPRLEIDKNIKTQTTTFSIFGGLSFTARRAPGEVTVLSGSGLNASF